MEGIEIEYDKEIGRKEFKSFLGKGKITFAVVVEGNGISCMTNTEGLTEAVNTLKALKRAAESLEEEIKKRAGIGKKEPALYLSEMIGKDAVRKIEKMSLKEKVELLEKAKEIRKKATSWREFKEEFRRELEL